MRRVAFASSWLIIIHATTTWTENWSSKESSTYYEECPSQDRLLDLRPRYVSDSQYHMGEDPQADFRPIIALFGNVAIKRQCLHVRFLNCYASLLTSLSFRLICQRLKLPVGFRVITVEVILMNVMLRKRNFGEFSDII